MNILCELGNYVEDIPIVVFQRFLTISMLARKQKIYTKKHKKIIDEKLFVAKGIVGLYPETGDPYFCLSDFIAPKDSGIPDYLGLFAVGIFGAEELEFISAQSDHREKITMWKLMNVFEETGIELTDGLAMLPAASVSVFANPESQYLQLEKLKKIRLINTIIVVGNLDDVEIWKKK
ncbi:9129_t:CDS:2 [Racocetra fulgida]|uniref:9129_t:CDS:1 n=1 Tax=Racocetra fulgida TaxID=60492 RepID=A0A9N9A4E8_9GLOM|nr:9129_t:CDS:2 [Racocetra fulgida]